MSAIGPNLETYAADAEDQRYFNRTAGAWRGVQGLGAAKTSGDPQHIADKKHAGLVRMAMTRQAIFEDLARADLQVRAQFGTAAGTDPAELFLVTGGPAGRVQAAYAALSQQVTDANTRSVYMRRAAELASELERGLDPNTIVPGLPVGVRGPEWNSFGETLGSGGFRVLSWTSKMDAPSFSLPAGTVEVGGACPGAAAGQTTAYTPENRAFVAVADIVRRTTGYTEQPGSPKWFADAVCQWCYAEGGNYAYGSKQLAAILLFEWTKQALATPTQGGASNEFIDLMIPAIQNAEYMPATQDPLRKKYGRFFRIHDSGDFFSARYLAAWKQIAEFFRVDSPHRPKHIEPIVFWAPSRIWATPWGNDAVARINGDPGNLVIRASAYHLNTPAITPGPGWAAGTAVTGAERVADLMASGAFGWDCPAYAADNEKVSCTSSRAPAEAGLKAGARGCRACWTLPRLAVNYTAH